jgi:hypothetical protein
MKTCFAALTVISIALCGIAYAQENSKYQGTLTEAHVRTMSDTLYTDLLRQSYMKGHRFPQAQIENGYKRHLEEFRLRLIQDGYTILVGDAGA